MHLVQDSRDPLLEDTICRGGGINSTMRSVLLLGRPLVHGEGV